MPSTNKEDVPWRIVRVMLFTQNSSNKGPRTLLRITPVVIDWGLDRVLLILTT